MRKYPVAYNILPGSFTKEELLEKELGGCDAVIVHSIILPGDGSRSEVIGSCGSDGKPLSDHELWKSWVSMAWSLHQSETLSGPKKTMCDMVFKTVQAAVMSGREVE